MSGNPSSKAKPRIPVGTKGTGPRRDQRVERTRERLGLALLALIQERPIDEVTVQDVLNRASVGRSTFYLHFRGKDDLLLCQFEWFLEIMSTRLSASGEKSHRLVPVREMFEHLAEQRKLYRALGDCGRLRDFFELAEGYFARGIARRLTESSRFPNVPQRDLDARAHALPAACSHCCAGGSTVAQANRRRRWMISFIAWSGAESGSSDKSVRRYS